MEDPAKVLRRLIALYREYLREDIGFEAANAYAKAIIHAELELAAIDRSEKSRNEWS